MRALLLMLVAVLPALAATVTSLEDDGRGSLRQVLRSIPQGASVTFAPALAGGTIHLRSPLSLEGQSVVIDARAAPGLSLRGSGTHRLLDIVRGEVTVVGLGFVDGFAQGGKSEGCGGAIRSNGRARVTLIGCSFRGNRSDGYGGGAVFFGWDQDSTVIGCHFEDNHNLGAEGEGGVPHYGGAISIGSMGSLSVRDSSFRGNSAAVGGAVAVVLGGLTIEGCSFEDNRASSVGAAIATDGASDFPDDDLGGRIELRNSRFVGNETSGQGGACFLFVYAHDTIEVAGCHFQDNRSVAGRSDNPALGAAIRFGCQLHDGVTDPGPDYRSYVLRDSSFVSNRSAGGGGAIWLGEISTGSIVNCTFADNASDGGTLALYSKRLQLVERCTFFGNRSSAYGGVFAGGTEVMLRGCLFAANEAVKGGPIGIGMEGYRDGGGNVQAPGGSDAVAGITRLDPRLGPLQTGNGQTMVMVPGVAALAGRVGAWWPEGESQAAPGPDAERAGRARAERESAEQRAARRAAAAPPPLAEPAAEEVAVWERELLARLAAALAAGGRPDATIPLGSSELRIAIVAVTPQRLTIRNLEPGGQEMVLPWRSFTPAARAELARATLPSGAQDPPGQALAGAWSLLAGDRKRGVEHLDQAGVEAASVRRAFGLTDEPVN